MALFDRSASPIELTLVGERVLARGREILGLVDAMEQEISDHRGLQQGSLRIGSFGATSSLQLLPDLLERFRQSHPGISVMVEEAPDDEVARWIEERRVDLGFVTLPEDRFQTWPLAEDQFVALVAADSSLAKQSDVSLKDLCAEPFIMPQSGSGGLVQKLFLSARLSPDIRYRTTQLLSILTMVGRGQGVSVVAEMALPPVRAEDGWVAKPLRPKAERKIGLAIHPTANASPATMAFIAMATGKAP